jgi:hypothetical protein
LDVAQVWEFPGREFRITVINTLRL